MNPSILIPLAILLLGGGILFAIIKLAPHLAPWIILAGLLVVLVLFLVGGVSLISKLLIEPFRPLFGGSEPSASLPAQPEHKQPTESADTKRVIVIRGSSPPPTQGPICTIITEVQDPGLLSAGQDFTCRVTIGAEASYNVTCGWSKCPAGTESWQEGTCTFPVNGGRWDSAWCANTSCEFEIRMDPELDPTAIYFLVAYDMSCNPSAGSAVRIQTGR